MSVLLTVYSNGGNQANAQEIKNGQWQDLIHQRLANSGCVGMQSFYKTLQNSSALKNSGWRKSEQKQEIKETFSRYMGPSLVDYGHRMNRG
ncbi:MAG: hypothetical protein IPJ90_03390 [Anaerolineaceae bacterium]|nr:hypothetical protein [Anaerolineaceae bacterium]